MEAITLKAVGDMCFADPETKRSAIDYLRPMQPHLDADILCGNLECVLVPADEPVAPEEWPKGLYADETAADALRETGFDIVWLANNHILDLGDKGILDTKRLTEQRGILTVGGGADPAEARVLQVIEKKGITVGFLAYAENCPQLNARRNPGPAYNIFAEMEADITAAREAVDVLIVVIHADLEFLDYPSRGRMEYSHKLADLGVDLIIEGHPHVPQGIETRGKTLISYCLGNFIFNLGDYQLGGSPWTTQSYILEVELSKNGIENHSIIPYQMEDGVPRALEGETLDTFNKHFEKISADLADPKAMELHDREMVEQYLEKYINWAYGAIQRGGTAELLETFLPRFYMGECNYFAREAARLAKLHLKPLP